MIVVIVMLLLLLLVVVVNNNDNTHLVEFLIYLHSYSAAQRPAKGRNKMNAHANKRQNMQTCIMPTTVIQLMQSRQPLFD
jgi:hypothetical protein